jgi:hypothetical protein
MSKGFKWSLMAILLGVVVFLLGPALSMLLPGWNCTKDEINISTGQMRHSRYIAFVRVAVTTSDTPLSLALGKTVSQPAPDAWRPVNTFAPPSKRVSPHYRFHGALTQAKLVGAHFEMLNTPPERRSAIAKEILRAWQTAGGEDGARDIIQKLGEELK